MFLSPPESYPPLAWLRYVCFPLLLFAGLFLYLLYALPNVMHARSLSADTPAGLTSLLDCAPTITPGDTITCAISVPDEVDTISVQGTAGDVFMLRASVTAGDMQPAVELTGPNGASICKASNWYGSGVEVDHCTLLQDGIHTITVRGTRATQVGNYNLYIQRLNSPANPTALALGDVMVSTIAAAARADTYTIAGTAGEVLLLRVAITAGQMLPAIRVYGADGIRLCERTEYYTARTDIANCALPRTETYTIIVGDSRSSRTGTYNLFAQQLTAPVNARPIVMGIPLTSTIRSMAQADTYILNAVANDVLLLRAGTASGQMTPGVRVFAPDGTILCSAGNSYSTGSEINRCALPHAGNYLVMVDDMQVTRTGDYGLYVQRINAPENTTALSLTAINEVQITSAAMAATFTISAQANDVLMLRAGTTSGQITPHLLVYDQDGILICQATSSYNAGLEITQCLLPRTGSYTILVGDARITRPGNIALFVQHLVRPTQAPGIRANTLQSIIIDSAAITRAWTWMAGDTDRLQVRMTVTSGTLRPQVRVFDRDGVQVCTATAAYDTVAEIADCLLPRSGRYTILANDVSGVQTGSATLNVTCLSATCGPEESVSITDSGGTVNSANARLDVPATAFTQPISLTLLKLSTPATSATDRAQILSHFFLQAYNAEGVPVTEAQTPMTFTLQLNSDDLDAHGVDQATPGLYYWDTVLREWRMLDSVFDPEAMTITALLTPVADVALFRTIIADDPPGDDPPVDDPPGDDPPVDDPPVDDPPVDDPPGDDPPGDDPPGDDPPVDDPPGDDPPGDDPPGNDPPGNDPPGDDPPGDDPPGDDPPGDDPPDDDPPGDDPPGDDPPADDPPGEDLDQDNPPASRQYVYLPLIQR